MQSFPNGGVADLLDCSNGLNNDHAFAPGKVFAGVWAIGVQACEMSRGA